MHEMSLRGRVAHMKVPAYPENSTACGVAVAQFEIGTAGQIYSHRILTAPDGATRVALENALAEWRFSPLTGVRDSDMASHFVGKLTFYFVNVSGDVNEAKVYSAQDAPFVGDCVLRDIAKARQS